jgi:lipopolysaccharide export system protein LptA
MSENPKITRWVLATAAAAVLAAPGLAAAQLAPRSDAPIDVTADELEVVNSQCMAIYRGAAEALQDTTRLRANVLRIYYKPGARAARPGQSGNCGADIDRIEAQGAVYYVTPQQRVRGNNAVYNQGADTITMTGDVVAAQAQNVLRGEKVVIKVSTGDATVQSNVKGRNKPGRVRSVIYPSRQSGQTAQR